MAPALALVRSLGLTAAVGRNRHAAGDGPFHAGGSMDGPLGEASRLLYGRGDRSAPDASHGVLDPHDISNVGFFVLFALIGVAFVVTGIWFFFWAKNGGFHFKEGDWEEYKSTVLRRKGPNGSLLSGATPSTDLGGGSVYKDVRDDEDGTTVVTESTGLSGITAGASDVAAREKRRARQDERERRRRRAGRRKGGGDEDAKGRRVVGEEGIFDEAAEKEALEELRSYRHEKAARVGGLNKASDGSQWDGSTNPSESAVSSEVVSSSSSSPPPPPPPPTTSHQTGPPPSTTAARKTAGAAIRKVYSTADRNERREAERIRAEARRLREESRSSRRRDFSYNRPEASESAATESLLEAGRDLGSQSRLVPRGLETDGREAPKRERTRDRGARERERERERERKREREERRARRGGYRRGRGDDDEL